MKNKYSSKDKLEDLIKRLRKKNKKIVFTNGCFDIIHPGHIYLLKKSKDMGDVLIVGLNSDSSIKKIKSEDRPINKESDRVKILESIKHINYVTIFNEETPLKLIKLINPDILVKGGDYKINEIVGSDFVIQNGGEVKIIPFIGGHSTSKLIDRIIK